MDENLTKVSFRKNHKRSIWWIWFLLGVIICFLSMNDFWIDPIKPSLKSLSNSTLLMAFTGTVSGALTLMFIDWGRRKRQILADINTSIGILTSLGNTILNIKKDHTLPMLTAYQDTVNAFKIVSLFVKSNNFSDNAAMFKIPLFLQQFKCPKLYFDLPVVSIFTLTDKMPEIVPIINQTKRSISDLENIYEEWNELSSKIKELPQNERIVQYFGVQSEGIIDTYFGDTVIGISETVDDALFFINLSIKSISKLAERVLPFWLKKNIVKSSLFNSKNSHLIPKDDYKKDSIMKA